MKLLFNDRDYKQAVFFSLDFDFSSIRKYLTGEIPFNQVPPEVARVCVFYDLPAYGSLSHLQGIVIIVSVNAIQSI